MIREQFIELHYRPYEEHIWCFVVRAGNGSITAEQLFYLHLGSAEQFASQLSNYGETLDDDVRLELGNRTGNWAYYVLFHAFMFDRAGHSALSVIFDNREDPPRRAVAEFSIQADAGQLNEFGRQFAAWLRNPQAPFKYQFRAA